MENFLCEPVFPYYIRSVTWDYVRSGSLIFDFNKASICIDCSDYYRNEEVRSLKNNQEFSMNKLPESIFFRKMDQSRFATISNLMRAIFKG